MEQNIWIDLVKKFCDDIKGEGRYGFTIPFIVGLEKEKNNRFDFTITDVFRDIKENEDELILSYCKELGEVGEFIIGKHKKEYPPIQQLNKVGSILTYDDSLDNLNSINEIITVLEERYYDKIENSLFSINGTQWSYFTAEDEKLIKKLK